MNYGLKNSKQYLDWGRAVEDSPLNVLAVDQSKFNLTWLCYPEIEASGLEFLPPAYVAGVNEYMDKKTRAQLLTLPLSFMRYWGSLPTDGMMLTQAMPEDYMARMVVQAHKAQARIVVRSGNVIQPEFWRAH